MRAEGPLQLACSEALPAKNMGPSLRLKTALFSMALAIVLGKGSVSAVGDAYKIRQ